MAGRECLGTDFRAESAGGGEAHRSQRSAGAGKDHGGGREERGTGSTGCANGSQGKAAACGQRGNFRRGFDSTAWDAKAWDGKA